MKIISFSELAPANSAEEFQLLCKTSPDWLVKTRQDVEMLQASSENPWKSVPIEAFRDFVDNLEFKNGGLAHSHYSSLEPHMNVREFLNMWSYFGISRQLFLMEADKKCDSPGTCKYCNGCSCTSNC
jgi:hypothetical protein